jgi:hypothetical protein
MNEKTESVKDTLQTGYYFATAVHMINKPEYIKDVLPVFDEHIALALQHRELNPIYPSVMTDNLLSDKRTESFAQYVVGTGWNIMQSQGYDMRTKVTYFHSLWGQQHHKYSNMEEHVHGDNVQLVGFYFLDVPENGCKIVLHDPRPGKTQISLPEADTSQVTPATNTIVFTPTAGTLFFANAWLPHSFSRNESETPVKFIHFNIGVKDDPNPPQGGVEGPVIV